jgi:hypothetical protein
MVGTLPYCKALCDHFGMLISDETAVARTPCVASVEYREGQLLLIQTD